MAFFEWQSDYSVNIAEIDEQHRKLVAMVNRLFVSMATGQAGDVIEGIVSELVSYAGTHFQTEETLMRLHGFPGFEAHKQKHEAMAAKVVSFQQRLKSGTAGVTVDLSNYLKGWLLKHIAETDKGYSAFLNGKGIR